MLFPTCPDILPSTKKVIIASEFFFTFHVCLRVGQNSYYVYCLIGNMNCKKQSLSEAWNCFS